MINCTLSESIGHACSSNYISRVVGWSESTEMFIKYQSKCRVRPRLTHPFLWSTDLDITLFFSRCSLDITHRDREHMVPIFAHFQIIFLWYKMYTMIRISLQHVPIGSLNNTPAVVHKMSCYQNLYLHKGKNKSKSKKPLFIVGLCKA